MQYVQILFSTSYFVPVTVMSIFLYLPSILLFYPTRIFHRILSRTGFCFYNTISVLADAFQGHYKDGTEGTRDYRPAFSCSYILCLVYPVAMCQYSARLEKPTPFAAVMIYTLLVASLFYALVQPCKKAYINIMESLVYATASLVVFNLYTFDLTFGTGRVSAVHSFVLYFTLFLVMLPSLVFCVAFLVRLFRFMKATSCCTSKLHSTNLLIV